MIIPLKEGYFCSPTDQHKAETLRRIQGVVLLPISFNQLSKYWLVEELYVLNTTCQMIQTNRQVISKCSTVSSKSQKEHFLHHFHLLLTRLSSVSKIFLPRYVTQKLLFKRNFKISKIFSMSIYQVFIHRLLYTCS